MSLIFLFVLLLLNFLSLSPPLSRIPQKMKRLAAVFTRPNAKSDHLHRVLKNFVKDRPCGEFRESRLQYYKRTDEILQLNHESPIKALGIGCLLYQRYFVYHSLLFERFYINSEYYDNLRSTLKQSPPDQRFLETIEKTLDVIKPPIKDVYRQVLITALKQDPRDYFSFEERVNFDMDRKPPLSDLFVLFNRETMDMCRDSLKTDIRILGL